MRLIERCHGRAEKTLRTILNNQPHLLLREETLTAAIFFTPTSSSYPVFFSYSPHSSSAISLSTLSTKDDEKVLKGDMFTRTQTSHVEVEGFLHRVGVFPHWPGMTSMVRPHRAVVRSSAEETSARHRNPAYP